MVLRARDRAASGAPEALAELCRDYWYPLYAFIRRQVDSAERAEDLTQEFFARLMEKEFLDSVDQSKGKFRDFLKACCKHFLPNQRDRDRARKRGGGRPIVSLDLGAAAERYRLEPSHDLTAEKLFDRCWALSLLEQVLDQLAQEYRADNKGPLFDRLKAALVGGPDQLPYAQIGTELGLTEAAVKKAAQRLRQRYRELLRARIAETVEGAEQIDEEVRDLFAALDS
jgi:RNA polymerase sigma-70 factor (ECF subfamily)